MQSFITLALIVFTGATATLAGVVHHPEHSSLAGLSNEPLGVHASSVKVVGAQPMPPKPTDTSYKLVDVKNHPHRQLVPGDQRGPCPGLNVLASHGYLPRSGVATPAQIINAVIEGWNMEYNLAASIAYSYLLLTGNVLTNLVSIGRYSPLTGPTPPPPATAGGLGGPSLLNGDASMTRSDIFIGDPNDLNMTLFNQLVDNINKYGNGRYNVAAAAEHRWQRIQDSIAQNPHADLGNPQFTAVYGESAFALEFFSGAETPDGETGAPLENIRSIYLEHKFPEDFHRRGTPFDGSGNTIPALMAAHPLFPGVNNGTVNSYIPVDFNEGETPGCAVYAKQVKNLVELYPNPKGVLRAALITNLEHLYSSIQANCPEERRPYD
ncbi:heme-thiolate peroxidase [Auriculariales sp. MPI-PUGE-AT-0066]|nr:heme-thiolate peroxidase [Auriculariales sp. MPI-PUGE-AT-0066]